MAEDTINWADLVDAIQYDELVPVVGRDLSVVDGDGTTFESLLVSELTGELGLKVETPPTTLNELAIGYVAQSEPLRWETRKNRLPKIISTVLDRIDVPIPQPLLDLAKMTKINLFVTTTQDTLLEQAIEQVRGVECLTLCNSLGTTIEDLPEPRGNQPCVYHLFGAFPRKSGEIRDYAITEEDMLEYLHNFTREPKPNLLIDYLNDKEPIFLGCRLSDGVIRMLFRTLSNTRLFPESSFKFVESATKQDPDLLLFLSGLSAEYHYTDPCAFVSELSKRWADEYGALEAEQAAASPAEEPAPTAAPEAPDTTDHRYSVFVSYRRADMEAVRIFVESLQSIGISVWWDQDDIKSGDWRHRIKQGIRTCPLFLPMLSRNAQADESTAMGEWNKALERLENVSRDVPYIIPILLDDIEEYAEHIPSEFWDQNYHKAPGGRPDPKTLEAIRDAFRARVSMAEGRAA